MLDHSVKKQTLDDLLSYLIQLFLLINVLVHVQMACTSRGMNYNCTIVFELNYLEGNVRSLG